MTQGSDPSGGADQAGAASDAPSPYERLGVSADAGFDAVRAMSHHNMNSTRRECSGCIEHMLQQGLARQEVQDLG